MLAPLVLLVISVKGPNGGTLNSGRWALRCPRCLLPWLQQQKPGRKLISVFSTTQAPGRWPGRAGCLGAHHPSPNLRKNKGKTVGSRTGALLPFSTFSASPPHPVAELPGQEQAHCQQVVFAASQVGRLPAAARLGKGGGMTSLGSAASGPLAAAPLLKSKTFRFQ